jgi:LPXTG-motif cell wall-anchored protein
MRRRIRFLLSAALAGGLTLAAAASASAAPDPDSVYLFVVTPGDGPGTSSFGTGSKADGALAALPTAYTATEPIAIEIVGELGYAIVPAWVGPTFTTTLVTWDIDTGEVLSSTTIDVDEASLPLAPGWTTVSSSFVGLDSPDGAGLQTVYCVYVSYPDDTGAEGCFLGALDTVTAAFTATADISALRSTTQSAPNELATDPLTGATLLFYDVMDTTVFERVPYVVTIADGTVGTPTPMAGTRTVAGTGTPLGADFAADGTLWLSYAPAAASQQLLSFAPGAALDAAVPTVVGALASADPGGPLIPFQLTTLAVASWSPAAAPVDPDTDPETDPALLADTGATASGVVALAGGLLLAGAMLALARRRRAS